MQKSGVGKEWHPSGIIAVCRDPLTALHLIQLRHEAAQKQQQQHEADNAYDSSSGSGQGTWSATLYADPAKRSPLVEMPYLFVKGLKAMLQAGDDQASSWRALHVKAQQCDIDPCDMRLAQQAHF